MAYSHLYGLMWLQKKERVECVFMGASYPKKYDGDRTIYGKVYIYDCHCEEERSPFEATQFTDAASSQSLRLVVLKTQPHSCGIVL